MDYQQNWEKVKEIANSSPMPESGDTLFLFGGGLIGSLAVSILKDELEITAVCDNSEEKQALLIEGLPCISPRKLNDYKNPFVFISTVKYYSAIHKQLTEMGVRHCSLDAYVVRQHLAEFESVFQMLDDESRRVYAGILLCRVSGDVSDAEKYCCDNQYFCLPKFRYIRGEKGAFVDCGAFVGDTVEEMIKYSLDTAPRIYAFEPNNRAFTALKKRTAFLCDIWAIDQERIVCASYRIPRTGFDRWVNGENTRGEPAVYDIRQLQNILGIKRTAAYNLVSKVYLAQAPFRILKIGSLYRIPQYSLDNWLNGKTECEK